MDRLSAKSEEKIFRVPTTFKRFLYDRINTSERFIAIKGARGTGKTTLLLHMALNEKKKSIKVLYVSLDDLYFSEHSLYNLGESFTQRGGKLLLLDEVHKYPRWSRELKLLYDDFPDLRVIFTSSSLLDLYKGESDLSRRVIQYHLPELSFREFLLYRKGIEFPCVALEDLLSNHTEISLDVSKRLKPLSVWSDFLKMGAYPYSGDDEFIYFQKLTNAVRLTVEVDLPAVADMSFENIAKIKRLLYVLATNVPYIPNISKLALQVGMNRNALVRVLQLLNEADIIKTLYKQSKSITLMNKPDKVWLRNTNLMFALAQDSIDKGALRETFALQALSTQGRLSIPAAGDLLVNNKFTFEIGGRNKSGKQIKNVEKAFLLKDDIETGYGRVIPLWMLGLLF